MGIPDDWSTPAVVLAVIIIVAMFALAIVFVIKFLRTFKLVRSQLMPFGGKVAFWATLIYLVSPFDILPDPLLFDDIAVLAGAITYIGRLAKSQGIVGDGESDSGASSASGMRADPGSDDIIDIP